MFVQFARRGQIDFENLQLQVKSAALWFVMMIILAIQVSDGLLIVDNQYRELHSVLIEVGDLLQAKRAESAKVALPGTLLECDHSLLILQVAKLMGVSLAWSDSVTSYGATEIAHQLTLVSHFKFASIPVDEIMDGNFQQQSSGEVLAHFQEMKAWNNHITLVVMSEILGEDRPIKRAAVLSLFIAVAHICLNKLQNFDGAMALICALHNSSIFRLKDTWLRGTPHLLAVCITRNNRLPFCPFFSRTEQAEDVGRFGKQRILSSQRNCQDDDHGQAASGPISWYLHWNAGKPERAPDTHLRRR